jgi:hypothetical protein
MKCQRPQFKSEWWPFVLHVFPYVVEVAQRNGGPAAAMKLAYFMYLGLSVFKVDKQVYRPIFTSKTHMVTFAIP